MSTSDDSIFARGRSVEPICPLVSGKVMIEVRTMHGAPMALDVSGIGMNIADWVHPKRALGCTVINEISGVDQYLSFRGRSRRISSLNKHCRLRSSRGFTSSGTLNDVGSVEYKLIS